MALIDDIKLQLDLKSLLLPKIMSHNRSGPKEFIMLPPEE